MTPCFSITPFHAEVLKPGGMGIYPPNNLTAFPPIIWLWSTSAFPRIIWLWSTSERWMMFGPFFWFSRDFGEKNSLIFGVDLFFGLHLNSGRKTVQLAVKTFFSFFWSSLNLLTWKKSWSSFIPPMLKIGKNWGKIANYPPQCPT